MLIEYISSNVYSELFLISLDRPLQEGNLLVTTLPPEVPAATSLASSSAGPTPLNKEQLQQAMLHLIKVLAPVSLLGVCNCGSRHERRMSDGLTLDSDSLTLDSDGLTLNYFNLNQLLINRFLVSLVVVADMTEECLMI